MVDLARFFKNVATQTGLVLSFVKGEFEKAAENLEHMTNPFGAPKDDSKKKPALKNRKKEGDDNSPSGPAL